MKKKFVDEYHWIEENEMLDLVAIAQSSPGPIAVNGAIVVGYKLAGMIGVLVSIYWNDYSAVSDYLCDFGLLSGVPGIIFFREPDARRNAGRRRSRDCIRDV